MLSYLARTYPVHPRGNLTPEQHEALDRMLQPLKDSELSEAQRRYSKANGGHDLFYGFRVDPSRPLQYFIDRVLELGIGTQREHEYIQKDRYCIITRSGFAIRMLNRHIHDLAYPERKPLLFKFHVSSEVVAGTTKPTEMSGLAFYTNSDPFEERATWTQERLDLFLPHIRQVYQLPDDAEPRWYYDIVTYEAYKEMYQKLSSEQLAASS